MIQRRLQMHQWKAFRRHPMFGQSVAVKAFIYFILGILALYILPYALTLGKLLLNLYPDQDVVNTFYLVLPYFLILDFNLKLALKKNQSLQIIPYLTLPIRQSKLFNFLLIKEFYNIYNLYAVIFVLPFAFKVIAPIYGTIGSYGFILSLYLLSIISSLLVAITNNWANKVWYKILTPTFIIAVVYIAALFIDYPLYIYIQRGGELLLDMNPIIWALLIISLVLLRIQNKKQMRMRVYQEMQGNMPDKVGRTINVTFPAQSGEVGQFINLELKLLLRSKQLKSTMFGYIILFIIGLYQIIFGKHTANYFTLLYWIGFMIGGIGLLFSQYLFMTESSYFDGLMTRKHSFINLMRAKYYLYLAVSTISLLLSMILVTLGKVDFLFLISLYLYYIGLVYYLMFQNGVYNKKPYDIFSTDYMGWKSSSVGQIFISLIAMLIPSIVVSIIAIFSKEAATIYMLVTGSIFILDHNIWLKWTCKRVMKRKYIIMAGFRSNG